MWRHKCYRRGEFDAVLFKRRWAGRRGDTRSIAVVIIKERDWPWAA